MQLLKQVKDSLYSLYNRRQLPVHWSSSPVGAKMGQKCGGTQKSGFHFGFLLFDYNTIHNYDSSTKINFDA